MNDRPLKAILMCAFYSVSPSCAGPSSSDVEQIGSATALHAGDWVGADLKLVAPIPFANGTIGRLRLYRTAQAAERDLQPVLIDGLLEGTDWDEDSWVIGLTRATGSLDRLEVSEAVVMGGSLHAIATLQRAEEGCATPDVDRYLFSIASIPRVGPLGEGDLSIVMMPWADESCR